jgi:hypothetical protein
MNIKVTAIDHHRNGVTGTPFYPILFEWRDGDRLRSMYAVVTDRDDNNGLINCFVVDVDMAAAGDIRFFWNSWRGDHFVDDLRAAIREFENHRSGLEENPLG